jgi:2-polyprenyl-3-methyl-5-hydroxy-6-metoxy-1,4-benzoquinol methylase
MEYWQQQVIKTQDMIENLNEDLQYIQKYRQDEIHYWYYIPIMMHYDAYKNSTNVKNILDIGCGYGTLALFAKKQYGADVYGIDMLDRLGKLKNECIIFKKSNIEFDPIPWDIKFDRIIFTEILEHLLYNPIPTLKKIRESLSDDGTLYLSTPNACEWGRLTKYYQCISEMPNPIKAIDIDEHIYQYTEGELRDIINLSGFEIKEFQIYYW